LKISIITISFNAKATIAKTLQSVVNQSYKNIEHIIVDGGSKDHTIEICNLFPHLSKIISEPDKGVYDAFNKGIKLATGDVIGFLNADDTFYDENSIQAIVDTFSHNNVGIIYGNLDYINDQGKIVRDWTSRTYKKGLVKKAWKPAHPTFYCRKDIYDSFGVYNDSFKISGDFELCLRFLEIYNIPSFYLNKKLVKMLIGGISNNGLKSKWIIHKEDIRAFRINHISINSISFFFHKLTKIKQFF
jgi:glycosyltransferase involved in cell wall biosynthesis